MSNLFPRNLLIHDGERLEGVEFKGEWIAVPMEDYRAAALAPTPPDAPDVRGALARAWKRRAKMYKGLWSKQLREFHDWRTALRAAGISEMVDMNPDTVRLTVTVPREKRINEMVEERIAASKAPTPLAPHPGQNHDYRMTCLRCGEPGYLFVGFHSPGETYRWSEAMPKEAE